MTLIRATAESSGQLVNSPDRRTWPVFLVGSHRSGTTLTRFLLDSHPSIACPPESKFFLALNELMGYPQVGLGLRSIHLKRQEFLNEVGTFGRRLLDSYALKSNKRRWIDKTPNYYRILPFLRDIFDGKVLFIFIVRHPLDSILSLSEYFRDATSRFEDQEIAATVQRHGAGLQAWAHYWLDVYETIRLFSADPSNSCLTFRYEDLVTSPEEVMTDICEFIDESFLPEYIDAAWRQSHDFGMEDNKIRRTNGVHQESVGRWRSAPQAQMELLWETVRTQAEAFGYDIAACGPSQD